jgi:AP-1 complex subunit mu
VPLAKVADRFTAKQNELDEGGGAAPVLQDGSLSYLYVQYSNLYILAVTKGNVNAAAALVFLHKLVEIFKHYFHEVSLLAEGSMCVCTKTSACFQAGAYSADPHDPPLSTSQPEQLEEESLRDNFVIAYELLDEIMDFGYPQFTEAKILSEFIKTDAHRMAVQARPPMAVTNAVSWRQEGLFYKKNEVCAMCNSGAAHRASARHQLHAAKWICGCASGSPYYYCGLYPAARLQVFLDVVESVNLLVNSNGTVVRSEVVGALKMRAYLSGMVSPRKRCSC